MSIGSVQKYCNQGKIVAEKTSYTNYRRVNKDQLLKFMKENNISPEILEKNSKKTVLLIVPSEPERDLFQNFLIDESQKFRVEIGGDGIEGCIKAGLLKPDIILLAVPLPDLDAVLFCERIKGLSELKKSKIIIVADEGSIRSLEQRSSIQLSSILKRPVSLESFRQALESAQRYEVTYSLK